MRPNVLARLLRQRLQRVALSVLVAIALVAALADFIASDLPIALHYHDTSYWFPNLTHPAALRPFDNQMLATMLGPDDWAVFPLVPWGYNVHDLDAVLAAPSGSHWLGTDSGGRDVLARVVHGARVSLSVGVLSVLLLTCIGVVIGATSGYAGGLTDLVLMRLVEVVHSLPTILLLVTMLAIYRPHGFSAVLAMMTVIGSVRWTDLARLVRAEVLRERAMPYVEAARALGLRPLDVVLRHVLPNALTPVLVAASFSMAAAIVIEGALSFLGFGIPDDMASWGSMLSDVRDHIDAWWLALFPGAAMFLTVMGYNLVGEGLRDAIDPRLEM